MPVLPKEKGIWPPIHDDEASLSSTWPDLSSPNEEGIRRDLEEGGEGGGLLVQVLTWNQQGQPPPHPAVLQNHLLRPNLYHLYAIGTQECGASIATSVVLASLHKAAWEKTLQQTLGPRYIVLASHTLQAAHLILFVHRALGKIGQG